MESQHGCSRCHQHDARRRPEGQKKAIECSILRSPRGRPWRDGAESIDAHAYQLRHFDQSYQHYHKLQRISSGIVRWTRFQVQSRQPSRATTMFTRERMLCPTRLRESTWSTTPGKADSSSRMEHRPILLHVPFNAGSTSPMNRPFAI